MRIALINSPTWDVRPIARSMAGGLGFDSHEGMVLPPLELASMAATLREASHQVVIVDADALRLTRQQVLDRLDREAWDLFIGTVSLPTLELDASFLAELSRAHPNVRIFAKTNIRDHAILETLLKNSGATLILHGEADLSIADIVGNQSRNGTAWLETEGTTVRFRYEEATPIANLDQLPLPARDLLPNDRYVYPLLGRPVATLQTSRGCPYPCRYYCPYPLVEGVKWRAQSPERIARELEDVVERIGIRNIYFRDATFTLDQQRVSRLCDLIVARGWTLRWVCETRVDCLSETLLDKMKAAGCVGVLLGVETGDERIMPLREVKKGLTVSRLSRIRQRARELGVHVHFLLIVGLPQETRESILDTYELIRRHRPESIGVTIITPYPGTPLYAQAVREGWIESVRWQDYGGHQLPMHTPHLTRDELATGKRLLEEGFALLARAQEGQGPDGRTTHAGHDMAFLRWAYRLDEPADLIRTAIARIASQGPATSVSLSHATVSPPLPERYAVSVIIPTYNRRPILRKTLLAFVAQTVPPDQFEIIVVDDGSHDDTVQMVRAFRAPFTLRLLTQSHKGANAARNLGIRAAQGRVLLFTGDDMIPEPFLIEAHATFHERHPGALDGLLGFIDWSPELPISPFMRFIVSPDGGQQFAFHEVRDGMADFRLFYTSNISVKRSFLFRQPMWFDEEFTYPAYDDIELGYRLGRQGFRLHFEPRAVTRHHHAITVEHFVQRQRRAGHMAVVFWRKHPELGHTLLQIPQALAVQDQATEQRVRSLLQAARELEKPDLTCLRGLRLGGEAFDRVYERRVLSPLYAILLYAAYQWGVCEAARETPRPARSCSRSEGSRYDVSIIIPVWNKVELTRQCLTALAVVTTGVDYEVIVVDNGSTDETPTFLQSLHGDVQVIRNHENLGFAKACNQGARAARGKYLVFLNNDTIPQPNWLEALVHEVEHHPEVGIVGSKLLYRDDTVQHAGVVFMRGHLNPYHIYKGVPSNYPAANRRREFQAVTAACLLIRRELFMEVGMFDEGFHNGFEDVDLCLKVRAKGARIIYQPGSVLYHLESQTPGRKDRDEENSRRLRERWGDHWWLGDEDFHYYADGVKLVAGPEDRTCATRLAAFADEMDRAAWAHVAAVQAASLKQDWAGMRAELTRVHEWPNDRLVLAWGALMAERLKEPVARTQFLVRYLALVDEPEGHIALARSLLEQDQVVEADAHLRKGLAALPHHAGGLLLEGILSLRQEQYAQADKSFAEALQQGADRRRCWMGLGMAAMGRSCPRQAWEWFLQVLDTQPDDAEALHWLLQAGAAQNRWKELAEHLQLYVDRNPKDLAARFALAGVLVRDGRIAEARQELQALQRLDPQYEGLDELARAIDSLLPHAASSVSG